MPLFSTSLKQTQFDVQEVLDHIWCIIHDMETPSWFTRVSRNFGKTSAGTINADEWCSLIIVYLPITLISLWRSSPQDQHGLTKILDHTMDLVSAVYLAYAQTMMPTWAASYHCCIASYVGKLKEMYSTLRARPNHHATFHIYDYLLLFSSIHAWWTFPFEHLIGILQQLSTNHQLGWYIHSAVVLSDIHSQTGELEATMIQSFLKATKLHAWLSHLECPPTVHECKIILDHTYGKHHDAIEIIDNAHVPNTATPTTTPKDLYVLTHKHMVVPCMYLRYERVVYSQSSTTLAILLSCSIHKETAPFHLSLVVWNTYLEVTTTLHLHSL